MKAANIFSTLLVISTTAVKNPVADINKRFEKLETTMEKMSQELREKDEKIRILENKIETKAFQRDVADIPYGIWCGYNSGMWFDGFSTITFQINSFPNDFFEETNLHGTGGLNLTSGIFKAPISGTFLISVGFTSVHSLSEQRQLTKSYNQLTLRRNGNSLGRSNMYDYYSFVKDDDGEYLSSLDSRGGVATVEHLEEGDQVTLDTLNLDGHLVDINICFQLINGWKNMD